MLRSSNLSQIQRSQRQKIIKWSQTHKIDKSKQTISQLLKKSLFFKSQIAENLTQWFNIPYLHLNLPFQPQIINKDLTASSNASNFLNKIPKNTLLVSKNHTIQKFIFHFIDSFLKRQQCTQFYVRIYQYIMQKINIVTIADYKFSKQGEKQQKISQQYLQSIHNNKIAQVINFVKDSVLIQRSHDQSPQMKIIFIGISSNQIIYSLVSFQSLNCSVFIIPKQQQVSNKQNIHIVTYHNFVDLIRSFVFINFMQTKQTNIYRFVKLKCYNKESLWCCKFQMGQKIVKKQKIVNIFIVYFLNQLLGYSANNIARDNVVLIDSEKEDTADIIILDYSQVSFKTAESYANDIVCLFEVLIDKEYLLTISCPSNKKEKQQKYLTSKQIQQIMFTGDPNQVISKFHKLFEID